MLLPKTCWREPVRPLCCRMHDRKKARHGGGSIDKTCDLGYSGDVTRVLPADGSPGMLHEVTVQLWGRGGYFVLSFA